MSAPEPKSDPVSPFVHQVLGVYADVLPQVRFPDLDLSSLQGGAQELRGAQVEVERIEAELEAARNVVRAQSELLTTRAERALAYARVFADGDVALSERIAEVGRFARMGRTKAATVVEGAQPKKRGRPRKTEHDTSLFGATDAPTVEAVADNAA